MFNPALSTMSTSKKEYGRAKAACQRYNISRTTFWNWINNRPGFPQPIKVGPNTTLHDLTAIDVYLGLNTAGKEVQ